MKQSSEFWDKMAKRYPRYYDEAMQKDAKIIFDTARGFGIDFSDKSIVDIGCGTGTLAIPLASKAKNIVALDLSKPMLDIFEKDRDELDLNQKIEIYHTSWDEYLLRESFDIALASMTPAVGNKEQYDKFIKSTNRYAIFVGWGAYKDNDVIDAIVEKLGAEKKQNLNQAKRFANYLEEQKIHHQVSFFETSWNNSYSFNEAIEYCCSHLKNLQLDVDKKLIEKLLQEYCTDASVVFTTSAQKGIVVCDKSSKQ